MGAIASGETQVLQREIISAPHISTDRLEAITAAERKELHRRERRYRGDMPALDVGGKTVFLVDDGVATGSTIRAAIAALLPEHSVIKLQAGLLNFELPKAGAHRTETAATAA